MQLARFLNSVFKKDGFILIDANSKSYIIGNPKKEKPLKLKILNKKLHYKLLFHPDLYFGEAYTDGEVVIENGSLTDFLDLALMNFGRGDLNFFSYLMNRLRGSYRYLTNFNFIQLNYDIIVPAFFITTSLLLISKFPSYSFKKIVIQRKATIFLLFSIILFFGLLLIYTFEVIAISSVIYLSILPISFFHYQKMKKIHENEKIQDEEDLEDVL